MITLNNITLICIDDNTFRGINSINKSIKQVNFGAVKLLTGNYKGCQQQNICISNLDAPLGSKENYSKFVLRELNNYVDTPFVLITQWDGFVINGDGWKDEFFDYDYIGARWVWDNVVGNGGFSLRSKKFLEVCSTFSFELTHPEDHQICRIYKEDLEKLGLKFATSEVAHKFAVENETYTNQFGYHGGSRPRRLK